MLLSSPLPVSLTLSAAGRFWVWEQALPNHPITHISPLSELPRIASPFDEDGDLLEAQPDGFGAWLAIVSAGQEAAALGDQAQHGVQGWHRFRDRLLVENEGGAPLIGLEQEIRR